MEFNPATFDRAPERQMNSTGPSVTPASRSCSTKLSLRRPDGQWFH